MLAGWMTVVAALTVNQVSTSTVKDDDGKRLE